MLSTEFVILGGGVTGLSAGAALGDRAIVLERERSPGGLVVSPRRGDFWFDLVPHFLHTHDAETAAFVQEIAGDVMVSIESTAAVHTSSGITPYPIQRHIGALERDSAIACAHEMIVNQQSGSTGICDGSYESFLYGTFGRTLCELFFVPYNLKYWSRPLSTLAPQGMVWNIATPKVDEILRGLVEPGTSDDAYNRRGYFPRPEDNEPVRGMEVLSRRLAGSTPGLRCGHRITELVPERSAGKAIGPDGEVEFMWESGCLSTIPLPRLVELIPDVPAKVLAAKAKLTSNRALIAAFGIEGERPQQPMWSYFPDRSVSFFRLVYLNEFDERLSPPGCWSLLAEATEPTERQPGDREAHLAQVESDLRRLGVIDGHATVCVRDLFEIDPAYVVFTRETDAAVRLIKDYLQSMGITTGGRFGEWKYSSMSRDIAAGRNWAKKVSERGALR